MSKLSHTKAIKRKHHNKSKVSVKKTYSRKEMQELMPGFRFAKMKDFRNFIQRKITMPNGEIVLVSISVDKNGQIYDCTRIGNVLSFIKGRNPNIVNWIARMFDEYVKIHEEWN